MDGLDVQLSDFMIDTYFDKIALTPNVTVDTFFVLSKKCKSHNFVLYLF